MKTNAVKSCIKKFLLSFKEAIEKNPSSLYKIVGNTLLFILEYAIALLKDIRITAHRARHLFSFHHQVLICKRGGRALFQGLGYLMRRPVQQLTSSTTREAVICRETVISELMFSVLPEETIKITFYAAVRRKGNPDCNLGESLKSIVKNCHNLNLIEVLIAIDPDEPLEYFSSLKSKYGQLFRLRFIVMPKRYGYQNLHLYDKELHKYIAKNTRMLCDFSDDCRILIRDFDKLLLEIDAKYPDNIYFIHTRNRQRECYLGDVAEHHLLLFWVMQAREPASFFPIVSRKVLDIAFDYAKVKDTHDEWSPLSNVWITDCYLDILSTYVKSLGLDRITFIDLIEMCENVHDYKGTFSRHYHIDHKFNLTPNNIAFIKMLKNETQIYLHGLAEKIVNYATQQVRNQCVRKQAPGWFDPFN